MVNTKSVAKRLNNLEILINKSRPPAVYLVIKNLDNKYLIKTFKSDTDLLYDKIEDFYKDYNINTKDKNNHVIQIKIAPNRTYESVFNDND